MYGTSDEMPDANTCSIRSLDRHQPIDRFVWCSRNASGTSRASCDMAHRCPQLEFWSPQEFHHIFGCFQFHKKQTSAKSWTPWTFSTVHLISKSFCSPVLCCSLSLGRPTSPPICQWLFSPIPSSRNFRWFNWCQLGALRKSFPHPARIQETRRAQASWSNPTSSAIDHHRWPIQGRSQRHDPVGFTVTCFLTIPVWASNPKPVLATVARG